MKKLRFFVPLVVALVAADLALIFGYAPLEARQGMAQKIFYWHVASAITMFAAFFLGGLFSLLYLVKKNVSWDGRAVAFIEVGLLFCTIVLLTGPLWAKPIWGVWWTWEPRLTSTFFLWLIFVSYFILRGSFADPGRKRAYSAVLAILGCLDIPLIVASVRLWRGVHPRILDEWSNMPGPMWGTFIFTVATVLLTGFVLAGVRAGLEGKKVLKE